MLAAAVLGIALLVSADGGVCSASSSAGDRFAPGLAFDGDPATRWSAAFEDRSGWIEITFPAARTCDRVSIRGEGPELKGMPGKLRVLYLDGKKWATALIAENVEGPEVTLRFEAAASPTWRLRIDSAVNPRWSPTIAELRFFLSGKNGTPGREATPGREGAPPFAPAATASASSSERYAPSRAVDGDMTTKWCAPHGETTGWLRLEYPEAREFNFLAFDVDGESGYGVPREYRLEACRGKTWKTVLTVKDGARHFARKAFRRTKSAAWRLAVESVINPRYSLAVSEIRLTLEDDPEEAAAAVPPPGSAPAAGRIRKAVERGRDHLLGLQSEGGSWDTPHTQKYPSGVAALGVLTLMKCGLDPSHSAVSRALAVVTAEEPKTVYGAGLALMALDEAGRRGNSSGAGEHRTYIEDAARFLAESQDGGGLWGYPEGRSYNSNAQYALLGLHAAAGAKVPATVWTKAGRAFLRSQLKDGGWNYVPSGRKASEPATGSMTAAGIASLLLARRHAADLDEKDVDAALERGFDWLAGNFTMRLNPGSPDGLGHYYFLYGIERVGQFAGRTKIGPHAWYGEGAAHLLRFQRADGGWQGSMTDTCFALLFLTQASRPLSGN